MKIVPIEINDYRCPKCGKKKFFLREKDKDHMGIYCSSCGRYLKWANHDERNLIYLCQEH